MKPQYEIVCIKREQGYLEKYFNTSSQAAITEIGYRESLTGQIHIIPILQAIKMIKSKTSDFYVTDGRNKVRVFVKEKRMALSSEEYLTTEADGIPTNNLENLPECT